jgi:hypothetical protein
MPEFTKEMEAQLRAILEVEGFGASREEIEETVGEELDEEDGPYGKECIEAFVAEAKLYPQKAIDFLNRWKMRPIPTGPKIN